MGFLIEPAGENIRLTITNKEGFTVSTDADGSIILEGPIDGFRSLGRLLGAE